jgi:hypothetical protein
MMQSMRRCLQYAVIFLRLEKSFKNRFYFIRAQARPEAGPTIHPSSMPFSLIQAATL